MNNNNEIETSLSNMDRTSGQISKETELNTVGLLTLIDIYGTPHLIKAQYVFFSSTYKIFSRVYHMLDKKKKSLKNF